MRLLALGGVLALLCLIVGAFNVRLARRDRQLEIRVARLETDKRDPPLPRSMAPDLTKLSTAPAPSSSEKTVEAAEALRDPIAELGANYDLRRRPLEEQIQRLKTETHLAIYATLTPRQREVYDRNPVDEEALALTREQKSAMETILENMERHVEPLYQALETLQAEFDVAAAALSGVPD
jgi:hypothetical protein